MSSNTVSVDSWINPHKWYSRFKIFKCLQLIVHVFDFPYIIWSHLGIAWVTIQSSSSFTLHMWASWSISCHHSFTRKPETGPVAVKASSAVRGLNATCFFFGAFGQGCQSQRKLWRSFLSTLNQAWILCVLPVDPFVECNLHSLCSLIQPEECRLHSTKKGHKISKSLKLQCPQQSPKAETAITRTLKSLGSWDGMYCILVNLSKTRGLGESERTTLGWLVFLKLSSHYPASRGQELCNLFES